MRKSNSYLVKTQILLFHSRYPASSMRTPIASTHIVQVYSAFSVPRHICITFNSLYKNKYTRRMCVCAAARLAYAVLASRLKKAFWVRPGDSVRPSARERFHLFLSAPLSLPLYLSLSICAQWQWQQRLICMRAASSAIALTWNFLLYRLDIVLYGVCVIPDTLSLTAQLNNTELCVCCMHDPFESAHSLSVGRSVVTVVSVLCVVFCFCRQITFASHRRLRRCCRVVLSQKTCVHACFTRGHIAICRWVYCITTHRRQCVLVRCVCARVRFRHEVSGASTDIRINIRGSTLINKWIK